MLRKTQMLNRLTRRQSHWSLKYFITFEVLYYVSLIKVWPNQYSEISIKTIRRRQGILDWISFIGLLWEKSLISNTRTSNLKKFNLELILNVIGGGDYWWCSVIGDSRLNFRNPCFRSYRLAIVFVIKNVGELDKEKWSLFSWQII
jgi:hypothetical protein